MPLKNDLKKIDGNGICALMQFVHLFGYTDIQHMFSTSDPEHLPRLL